MELAMALAQDGFTREMAIRLLGGERFSIDDRRFHDYVLWYRSGDYIIHQFTEVGVDDVYLVSTGELIPF